jgi:hypothetical protein
MLFAVLAAYFLLSPYEQRLTDWSQLSLREDGYVVFRAQPHDLVFQTLSLLPRGYVFLDYSYTIVGDSLVTWHRDVTSGQAYHGAAHPTYTLIHYFCDGDLLSVSPGSHLTLPFSFGAPRTIVGWNGTAVLFNADLLHAGAPNRIGKARYAIQYKIAHRDDLAALGHLSDIHAVKRGEGGYSFVDAFRRWYSWKFAWISNTVLYPFMQRRHDGWRGALQRLVNMDFYNN